jgi:hypothetical protein
MSLVVRAGRNGPVLDPSRDSSNLSLLLPAGLPLGAINGRQNAQRYRYPQHRSQQHQGNLHVSAHASILGFGHRDAPCC